MPFKPGQSGHPAGRPKGAKGKALTNKQLAEYTSKCSKSAVDQLISLYDSSNDTTKLKACIAVMGFDLSMRQLLLKEIEVARKVKEAGKSVGNSTGGVTPAGNDNGFPKVSTSAVN